MLKSILAGAALALCLSSVAAAAEAQRQFEAFPAFSATTDSAALAKWAADNLVGGDKWTYLDENWAIYLTRLDTDENPPFRLGVAHFEVTSQAAASLIQARSLSRMIEVDCQNRTDRWLSSEARAGNNMMGDEVPTTAPSEDFAPFPDPKTAEGAVADALCAAK